MNNEPARESEYEEPAAVYANNVRFEQSAWDLRLFFGQLLPQKAGAPPEADWHTDVTIPWTQAKLMHFLLGVNLALYEAENGKISLPPAVLPPLASIPPPEMDQGDPQIMEVFQKVQTMIAEFREAQGKG
jgi:hypothetical protein